MVFNAACRVFDADQMPHRSDENTEFPFVPSSVLFAVQGQPGHRP